MPVSIVMRGLATVGVVMGAMLAEGALSPAFAQCGTRFSSDGTSIIDPIKDICRGFAPGQRVQIRRGTTSTITVVRHLINHSMTNAIIAGIGGTVSNVQTGTLFLNNSGYPIDLRGYIRLRVALPATHPLGSGTIIFPSALGNYNLPIQVVRKGLITGFAQQGPIPATWGEPVTVNIRGQDLDALMAKPGALPAIGGFGNSTAMSVSITSRGERAPLSGNMRVILYDAAIGYDWGQYGLATGVSTIVRYATSETTAVTGGTSGGTYTGGTATGGTTSPPPVPDLTPAWNNVLLRHVAPNRKLNTTFCSGMAAPATGSVSRSVTVPGVRWGVTNAGNGAVTTAFTAQLQRGTSVLQVQTVPSLAAGQTVWFTYTRPTSSTEVAKLALVPSDAQRTLYQATGGDCVQVSGQATATDWTDAPYTVVLDAMNAVTAETNKGDNTRTY